MLKEEKERIILISIIILLVFGVVAFVRYKTSECSAKGGHYAYRIDECLDKSFFKE